MYEAFFSKEMIYDTHVSETMTISETSFSKDAAPIARLQFDTQKNIEANKIKVDIQCPHTISTTISLHFPTPKIPQL